MFVSVGVIHFKFNEIFILIVTYYT
jgi:hypothetical protein